MTPEQLAKSGTESGHQRAVFCWAQQNLKRFPVLKWMHHIPNGGARGEDERTRAIRGNAMKAEGVKRGIPDIFLPVKRGNWSGLYIEMKKPGKLNTLSDEQIEFGEFAKYQGFGWVAVDNWQDAVKVLEEYLSWQ